jgi:hypothetical protein
MSYSCSDFQGDIIAALGIGNAIENEFIADKDLTDDDGPAIAATVAFKEIARLQRKAAALDFVRGLFDKHVSDGGSLTPFLQRAAGVAKAGRADV